MRAIFIYDISIYMNTVRGLKNAYMFADAYKERYIGGVVPTWTEYIKGKRIYKGESQREFMLRLSKKYEDDIRNDKILNKLDAIQQSIMALVEKLALGQPVSVAQLHSPISQLSQMPPPPPPPPPMQPQKPKKEMTEKEAKQASTRDQMMDELKQRLAKRGVIASGGRRRRSYNF